MFRGLARGGTRGGKDQFSWEDVKNDKDRENYIGHSLKASVGRWQKNRDIFWYTRGKNSDEAGREEVELMKKLEQRKMDEALGLVGPSENEEDEPINTLETHEMQELCRRGRIDEDRDENYKEKERVRGLGFALTGKNTIRSAVRETLEGVGFDDSNSIPPRREGRATGGKRGEGGSRHSRSGSESASEGDDEDTGHRKRRRHDSDSEGDLPRRQRHDSDDDNGNDVQERPGIDARDRKHAKREKRRLDKQAKKERKREKKEKRKQHKYQREEQRSKNPVSLLATSTMYGSVKL